MNAFKKIILFYILTYVFISAAGIIHIVIFWICLPTSDGAKISGVLFFLDPFVITIYIYYTIILSFVAAPILTISLWKKDIKKSFFLIGIIVFISIVLFSPFGFIITICGSVLLGGMSLLWLIIYLPNKDNRFDFKGEWLKVYPLDDDNSFDYRSEN
jgi:hypothetical protein